MVKTRPFLVFLSFLAVAGLALAQNPPDGGSRPTLPGNQPQKEKSGQMPEKQRPTYLSGKVIYDDGRPADTSVQVEMVCNGSVRRQSYTFSGVFSLEITTTNRRRLTVMDASTSSRDLFGGINSESEEALSRMKEAGGSSSVLTTGPGYANLLGCELRASQPGFQSDTVPLSMVRPMENPDVGVIVLHRIGTIMGATTSVVSMAAPKKAKKAYQKAVKEVRGENPNHEKAATELEKAIELYPEYAAAWELLGQIRLAERDEPGARQAFELASAGDPKFIQPNLAMMELEVQKGNWEEVSKWSSRVTELNPYIVQAQYYHGIASITLNRIEPAQQSFQKVRENYRGDDYPYVSYMLGYILADQIKDHLAEWEEEGHIKSSQN